MGVAQDESLAKWVGARIREERRQNALTLAELARASEVSTSYLSAVEVGRNVPSLDVLGRITRALGVSVHSMLAPTDTFVMNTLTVPDAPGATASTRDGLELQTFLVRYAGAESSPAPASHEGRDVFLCVLEGSLRVDVDDTVIDLGPRDALDLLTPGSVRVEAREPSVAVWAYCPPRPIENT